MENRPKQKKNFLNQDIFFGRVTLTQKALFAKHLSTLLKSGIPITEAISITKDAASGRFKKILNEILESVTAGTKLSSALSLYPNIFSNIFINAIYVGESSGTLIENLEYVAEQARKEKELIQKVRGAFVYPVIVLIAAFGLGAALSLLVLPKITPAFEGLRRNLPVTTKILINFSHFVQNYGVYLFLGIVVFFVFFVWLVKQKFSRRVTHWFFLNAPIFSGVTRNVVLVRFSRTLGILLKSGVNIDESLEIAKESIGNYYYERALEKTSQSVRKGAKLSENLARFENLFPVILTRMVKVGEESGRFEETLFYLADFYEAEVDNATKNLSVVIEPLLLLFIGLVVAFLALAIITPIYDITAGFKK